MFMRRELFGTTDPGLLVMGPVLAGGEEQARGDLALLETCPVLDRAIDASPYLATDVTELVVHSDEFYPRRPSLRGRQHVDGRADRGAAARPAFDRGDAARLALAHDVDDWGDASERPDMAFSLEDRYYIGLYAVYEDPAADAAHADWATERMRAMEGAASGIQLADENLGRRAAPFLAEDSMARLERVRAAYDPHGRFHSWMATP